MGFKHFIDVAKSAAADLANEIDSELKKNPKYVDARNASAKAASLARETADEALARIEATRAGKQVGLATRKVGQFVSTIPVLSVIGDATSEMAGIDALVQLRRENPENPWPLLWLSESLLRRESLSRTSLLLRATLEPFSAAAIASAKTAAKLDAKNPIEACERAAWAMALRNLTANEEDSESLHVASRVYLARGYPKQALALAAVAAQTKQSREVALFTAAQALLALGNLEAAVRAAEASIEGGCSLGYAILSSVALSNRNYREALALASSVQKADKERYFGVDPTLEAVIRGTLRQQKDKYAVAYAKSASAYAKAESRWSGTTNAR
jgi:hypothetical protein